MLEVIAEIEALKPGMSEVYVMGVSDSIAILRNHQHVEQPGRVSDKDYAEVNRAYKQMADANTELSKQWFNMKAENEALRHSLTHLRAALSWERNRKASEQVVMEKQTDAAEQAELSRARDIISRVFIPDTDFADKPLPKCLQPFSDDGNEAASKANEQLDELEDAFARETRRIIRTRPMPGEVASQGNGMQGREKPFSLTKSLESIWQAFDRVMWCANKDSIAPVYDEAQEALDLLSGIIMRDDEPTNQGALDDEALLHIAVQAFSSKQPEDMPFAEDAVQAVIDAVRPHLGDEQGAGGAGEAYVPTMEELKTSMRIQVAKQDTVSAGDGVALDLLCVMLPDVQRHVLADFLAGAQPGTPYLHVTPDEFRRLAAVTPYPSSSAETKAFPLSEPALARAALLCGANMSKAFAIAHAREIVLAYLDAARAAAGDES